MSWFVTNHTLLKYPSNVKWCSSWFLAAKPYYRPSLNYSLEFWCVEKLWFAELHWELPPQLFLNQEISDSSTADIFWSTRFLVANRISPPNQETVERNQISPNGIPDEFRPEVEHKPTRKVKCDSNVWKVELTWLRSLWNPRRKENYVSNCRNNQIPFKEG